MQVFTTRWTDKIAPWSNPKDDWWGEYEIINYNDDDDADGDGDEDDDNEDDADGEGDSEGVGDISYATHLSGQCLGPRPFFGRLQFIKLDHLPRHFGPHPTYISLLVTALCNTNKNRNKMKNLIQGSEFWAVQT